MTKINRPVFDRAASASSVLTSLMDGNAVSGRAVASATKSIGTIGGKLDNMIHGTAVACIYLSMSVAEGGPASGAKPAADLLNAMPKGSRAKALAAWFEAFSNIRPKFDKQAKAWTANVLPATAKTYALPRPTEAMDKPFWTVEERDTDPKAFDFGGALMRLIKKAQDNLAALTDAERAALADLTGMVEKRPLAKAGAK